MGLVKVVKVSDHKVRFDHQLNSDGTPYAENVTVELDESVDPSRMSYLTGQDGKVGFLSYSFSATEEPQGVKFPE